MLLTFSILGSILLYLKVRARSYLLGRCLGQLYVDMPSSTSKKIYWRGPIKLMSWSSLSPARFQEQLLTKMWAVSTIRNNFLFKTNIEVQSTESHTTKVSHAWCLKQNIKIVKPLLQHVQVCRPRPATVLDVLRLWRLCNLGYFVLILKYATGFCHMEKHCAKFCPLRWTDVAKAVCFLKNCA